jgi:hypothetical protein
MEHTHEGKTRGIASQGAGIKRTGEHLVLTGSASCAEASAGTI